MKFLVLSARIQRLIKEFSWVVVGQIAALLGSVMLLRLLTESLDPTQFGQLALGLTIVGFANAVLMGGVVASVGRFYSIAAEENDLPSYLRAAFRMMSYATAVVVVIALVMVGVLLWFGYTQWLGLVIAALILSVLGGFNAAIGSIQNAARQRSIVALHTGLDPWLKILFIFILMLWLSSSSTAVLLCYAFASLLIFISQLFFLKRLPQIRDVVILVSNKKEWTRKMWLFSWPFIIWGVFGWVQISSTRWALQTFGTTADVGYYSVLSQLGYIPIQTLISLFMTFLNPIIYAMAGNARDQARRENVSNLVIQIALVGIIITVLVTLFTYAFHRQIMVFLVAEQYWFVSAYLPILVAAGGVFGVAAVIAAKHLSFMSSKELMPASIGSSLIGIFAAFAGVYFYSIAGAAFAMLVHSVSYLILLFMVTSAQENKNETE